VSCSGDCNCNTCLNHCFRCDDYDPHSCMAPLGEEVTSDEDGASDGDGASDDIPPN